MKDGLHRIEASASGPWEGRVTREAWVVVANRSPDAYALDVRLSAPGAEVARGAPIVATVTVRRRDGTPVEGAEVGWAVYEHRTWDIDPRTATTGPDGTAKLEAAAPAEPGWLTLSAGVGVSEGPYRRRFGDLLTLRVR